MSQNTSEACELTNAENKRLEDVKRLISYFERIENKSYCKTNSTMGSEQSNRVNLQNSNFVKRRVSQFNNSNGDSHEQEHKSSGGSDGLSRDERLKSLNFPRGKNHNVRTRQDPSTSTFKINNNYSNKIPLQRSNQILINRKDRFDSNHFRQCIRNDKSVNEPKVKSVATLKKVFENSENSCIPLKNTAVPRILKKDKTNQNCDKEAKVEEVQKIECETDIYSEDDFNQIENKLHEMQTTIEEIKEHRNLLDSVDKIKKQKQTENIKVYLQSSLNINDSEDEFGQRIFNSNESINFAEAYNRAGDELILTSVGEMERKEYEKNDSVFINYNKDISENSNLEDKTNDDGNIGNNSAASSNRSTIYSSTHTNSSESLQNCSRPESYEGNENANGNHIYEEIRLRNEVEISSRFDRTIKTETIYDSFQNPRIAKVSNVDSNEHIINSAVLIKKCDSEEEALKSPTGLKSKINYLIEELRDSENKYIQHLEQVVLNYMPVITNEKLPPSLMGKDRFIFGNIKKIYRATRKFYAALKECKDDYEEIANTFIDFETHLFELYPAYSKNKPVADHYLIKHFKDIVWARQQELNDRLGLASSLLTPIQRLGKYILLLEKIQNEVIKNEGSPSKLLFHATAIVRKHMTRGNDYVAIDSIKGCPVSLLDEGSFLIREKFNIIKPKKYEAMLFLFEKMLVFTTMNPRNSEMFNYRDMISMDELGIVTFEDQPLIFHIKRFPTQKKETKEYNEYVIEAKKNRDKKILTEQIEKRLWQQLVKRREQHITLYKNPDPSYPTCELPDHIEKLNPKYHTLPSQVRKGASKSIFYYSITRES